MEQKEWTDACVFFYFSRVGTWQKLLVTCHGLVSLLPC